MNFLCFQQPKRQVCDKHRRASRSVHLLDFIQTPHFTAIKDQDDDQTPSSEQANGIRRTGQGKVCHLISIIPFTRWEGNVSKNTTLPSRLKQINDLIWFDHSHWHHNAYPHRFYWESLFHTTSLRHSENVSLLVGRGIEHSDSRWHLGPWGCYRRSVNGNERAITVNSNSYAVCWL